MNKVGKIFLLTALVLLVVGISGVSAADNDMSNTTISTVDTSVTDAVNDNNNSDSIISQEASNVVDENTVETNTDSVDDNSRTVDNSATVDNKSILGDDPANIIITDSSDLPNELDSNTIYVLDGITVEDHTITINGENTVLTGINDATLIDCYIEIYGENKNRTISNLTLKYTADYWYQAGIMIWEAYTGDDTDESIYTTIENCNITVESRYIEDYTYWYPITTYASAVMIRNNTLTGSFEVYAIDWMNMDMTYSQSITRTGFILYDLGFSEYITTSIIENNTITVTNLDESGESYSSFYGVTLLGGKYNFTNNTVSIDGIQWIYALSFNTVTYSNITNNNITVNGDRYVLGIRLSSGFDYYYIYDELLCVNNVIRNNTFTLTAGDSGYGDHGDGTYAEDVIYAIYIENTNYYGHTYSSTTGNVHNNIIDNNTITGSAHNVYGVELYGANGTNITNNVMTLEGSTPMGIGVDGTNSIIDNNTITVMGSVFGQEYTADYLTATEAGIVLLWGSYNNITNNTITSNLNPAIYVYSTENNDNIISNTLTTLEYEYAVYLEGSNTAVTNNTLIIGSTQKGNEAVYDSGSDNEIDNRITSQISLDGTSYSLEFGSSITINGTLTTEDGDIIPNTVVYVSVDDADAYTVDVDEDGKFSFTYNKETSDESTIIVSYESEDYYQSSQTVTIITQLIETSIEVEDINPVIKNSTFNVVATITPVNVAGQKVTVTFNGEDYDVEIGENGLIETNLTAPEIIGDYTITITYSGSDLYAESTTTTTVTVKVLSIINLTTVESVVVVGDDVTITGTVTDDEGNPITGEIIITINDNDGTIVGVVDGVYEQVYTTTIVGQNNITVTYQGDEVYTESESSDTFNVYLPTNITVDDVSGVYGDTVTLTAHVSDVDGNNVTGGQVIFKLNGKTLKDGIMIQLWWMLLMV
ncbi:MAG: Ig-like domain repeat protein [Methanosphaera sp.]|nr:Ig-like domain repeat protein [Methanosphaera sp.]